MLHANDKLVREDVHSVRRSRRKNLISGEVFFLFFFSWFLMAFLCDSSKWWSNTPDFSFSRKIKKWRTMYFFTEKKIYLGWNEFDLNDSYVYLCGSWLLECCVDWFIWRLPIFDNSNGYEKYWYFLYQMVLLFIETHIIYLIIESDNYYYPELQNK